MTIPDPNTTLKEEVPGDGTKDGSEYECNSNPEVNHGEPGSDSALGNSEPEPSSHLESNSNTNFSSPSTNDLNTFHTYLHFLESSTSKPHRYLQSPAIYLRIDAHYATILKTAAILTTASPQPRSDLPLIRFLAHAFQHHPGDKAAAYIHTTAPLITLYISISHSRPLTPFTTALTTLLNDHLDPDFLHKALALLLTHCAPKLNHQLQKLHLCGLSELAATTPPTRIGTLDPTCPADQNIASLAQRMNLPLAESLAQLLTTLPGDISQLTAKTLGGYAYVAATLGGSGVARGFIEGWVAEAGVEYPELRNKRRATDRLVRALVRFGRWWGGVEKLGMRRSARGKGWGRFRVVVVRTGQEVEPGGKRENRKEVAREEAEKGYQKHVGCEEVEQGFQDQVGREEADSVPKQKTETPCGEVEQESQHRVACKKGSHMKLTQVERTIMDTIPGREKYKSWVKEMLAEYKHKTQHDTSWEPEVDIRPHPATALVQHLKKQGIKSSEIGLSAATGTCCGTCHLVVKEFEPHSRPILEYDDYPEFTWATHLTGMEVHDTKALKWMKDMVHVAAQDWKKEKDQKKWEEEHREEIEERERISGEVSAQLVRRALKRLDMPVTWKSKKDKLIEEQIEEYKKEEPDASRTELGLRAEMELDLFGTLNDEDKDEDEEVEETG
ncbi:hypothetical protein BJ508DRAFT_332506 [Ascobolus immersus RN42]|uniref:Uncharacterized protein n=1 Tax=Ascobolus immersus RN42 TaxID=1160509 RepID=A0A3N4HTB9_ASCIM|nr:hypothetical protein BJ508DRAFT_332506 [Ascobolus immersus RN42]